MVEVTIQVPDELYRRLCMVSLTINKEGGEEHRLSRPDAEASLPYFKQDPSPVMVMAAELLVAKAVSVLGTDAKLLQEDPDAYYHALQPGGLADKLATVVKGVSFNPSDIPKD